VLDDGRLTDGRGRLVDFSNTVVIMTSNIGSERIVQADPASLESAEGREQMRQALSAELHAFFRPEFLNRVGEVVIFGPLGREQLLRIVDIQLRKLGKLLGERGLSLAVSDAAKAKLVELGYAPSLGARPLERAIVRHVQDPLAEALLSGRFGAGLALSLDVVEGELSLQPSKSADAP